MSELKQYHNQTVYTGGLNRPYLRTSVVLASDAEAALKEKDKEIARLKRIISELDYELSQYEKPIAKTALEARDE